MDINTKPIIINAVLPTKGFTGRHHTDESKEKIRKSKKGVPNMKNRKLSEVQIEQMKKDKENGDSITMLSNRYGVSRKTVYTHLYD